MHDNVKISVKVKRTNRKSLGCDYMNREQMKEWYLIYQTSN